MTQWERIKNRINLMLELKQFSRQDFMDQTCDLINYNAAEEFADGVIIIDKQVDIGASRRDLYDKIHQHLQEYLASKVAEMHDNKDALRTYCNLWKNYNLSAVMIDASCFHLISIYTAEALKNPKFLKIYDLFVQCWKNCEIFSFHERVTDDALKLIERERNGDMIDTGLISDLRDCVLVIGRSLEINSYVDDSHLDLYRRLFEDKLVLATQEFYAKESAARLYPVMDYVKHVEIRLREEEKRIELCLDKSSKKRLLTVCEDAMIVKHMDVLQDEFMKNLKTEAHNNLGAILNVCKRVPNCMQRLLEIFENHITKAGTAAIDVIVDENKECKDPRVYVATILDVYTKYEKVVAEQFDNEVQVVKAFSKAVTKFVNSNAVTWAANSRKSAELLAKFCDALLRKGKRNVDIETDLCQAIIMFQHLQDKDVFEKFYSVLLAKRSVLQVSASDDAEESMVSKLKQASGLLYVSKLEQMITDIKLSKNHMEEFKMDGNNTFEALVLTSTKWPLSGVTPPINIPESLAAPIAAFTGFYERKFAGRKLQWLHQRGRSEVITTFVKPNVTLCLSAYQAVLLLEFNTEPKWTIQQLSDRTNIDANQCVFYMQHFIRNKVIKSVDASVTTASVCEVNFEFSSKKRRLLLMATMSKVVKEDDNATKKLIDDGRQYVIEAAVVRIMKKFRTLGNNDLIANTLQEISARFKPEVVFIKKCIKQLVDRDLLDHNEATNEVKYIA